MNKELLKDAIAWRETLEKKSEPARSAVSELISDLKYELDNLAPYAPVWSLKPPSALGFRGYWTSLPEDGCNPIPGEFYVPAPEPSDEELNTKLLAMSREQKLKALEIDMEDK